MIKNNCAPIALFVYNRPEHAKRTIEALKRNLLAEDSELIIFSDAAKAVAQTDAVNEVREFVRQISGFKSVIVVEREVNLGLALSIIDGISAIVNKYGRVIVLEDDLVVSKYFLKYMNDALICYENDLEVISIHGYLYPLLQRMPNTFFIKDTGSWGWATWKRAWDHFEKDGRKLLTAIEERGLADRFNFNGAYPFTKLLKDQIKGKNNSWAIRWQATAFLNNKLTLFPGRSLLQNIGHDDSGTHCGTSKDYFVEIADKPLCIERIEIKESEKAYEAFEIYFRSIKKSFLQRVIAKLRGKVGSIFG